MKDRVKNGASIIVGIIFISVISYSLTSCDKMEVTTCDGVCDSSVPYSNSYSSMCYASKSTCEEKTGHKCITCD